MVEPKIPVVAMGFQAYYFHNFWIPVSDENFQSSVRLLPRLFQLVSRLQLFYQSQHLKLES